VKITTSPAKQFLQGEFMTDRYAAERFHPKIPACARSAITLHFDGRFLRAIGAKSAVVYPAVSGRMSNRKIDYSADRQKIPDQGPIPEGEYWITAHSIFFGAARVAGAAQ
jgi:hypothetical protein